MSFDEDPLDLLEDDEDGVIETILLFDDEEEKGIKVRTGCCFPIIIVLSTALPLGLALCKLIA